jgi:hypothetical protein
MRTLIPTVVILSLIPFSLYASGQSNSDRLAERVAELEAQVEVLAAALQETQEILQLVHVETELMDGPPGRTGSSKASTCGADWAKPSPGHVPAVIQIVFPVIIWEISQSGTTRCPLGATLPPRNAQLGCGAGA